MKIKQELFFEYVWKIKNLFIVKNKQIIKMINFFFEAHRNINSVFENN